MLLTIEACGHSNDGHKIWLCICDCGNMTKKQTNRLRVKANHNCGCFTKIAISESQKTHGMKYSSTYSSWRAAKDRCHNSKSKDFYRYGGAGIVMCEEWRKSFQSFYDFMGERPEGTSLDRYPDPSGNYEPGNCRWADPINQGRNRRNVLKILWRGEYMFLGDIAKELGISHGAVFMRLKRGKLKCDL